MSCSWQNNLTLRKDISILCTFICLIVPALAQSSSFPGSELHTEVNGNIAFSLAGAVSSTNRDYCSCYTVNLDKLAKQCSLLSGWLWKVFKSCLLFINDFSLFVFSCWSSWFDANAVKPFGNAKKYQKITFRTLKKDSLRLQLDIKGSSGSIYFFFKGTCWLLLCLDLAV